MRFFPHPGSGLEDSEVMLAVLLYSLLASFPFVFLLLGNIIGSNSHGKFRFRIYLFKLSIVGVLFCLMALKNYGHNTMGALVFGYWIQWLISVYHAFFLYRDRNK
jgi:L-lactate permease